MAGAREPGESTEDVVRRDASPPARPGPGAVIGDRWRLDAFLKSGGMGQLWRATDLRLEESVALKLMDASLVETEAARQRFFREAQAAARLRGAGVAQILDFAVDPETRAPYIAMELLHGEDLAERLARGPLDLAATTAIVAGVCGAIGRAHKQQIVHRDLKPANIFLCDGEDGLEVRVLDFGIVKLGFEGLQRQAPLTVAGATLGTVSYMSPEQIADAQRVDYRADLWSIGVVAYECLTGRRPFRGDQLLELVHEICYGTPVPPSRLAEVPEAFDAWFARATHRDRDHRFPSARELLAALQAVATRPTTAVARAAATTRAGEPPAVHWASDAIQIDIGALKDVTFKSAGVTEFLEGAGKHFVSGGKGLGKTLLLTYKRALLSEQYQRASTGARRQAAVQFVPEGRPYLDLMGDLPTLDQAQIDRMAQLDECKRLWSCCLRLSIVSYCPALLAVGGADELATLPRGLRGLLEGRPVEPTVVAKELLSLTVRQLSQVLDATEAPLERKIRALHSGVLVFVDKLDQALRRLPRAAWVHMQAGFVEAAWDLMNTNRHVKVYATIREEAFSSYESDIKTNLYGATTTLRYDKFELEELLDKLAHYYEGLPLRDFVLLEEVRTGRAARGEPAFDFLLRHTLGRPRDLVILASEISRNRRSLDERALVRIVQESSAGMLAANIFDEMRAFLEVLRDRDKRDAFFALLPHDVLSGDDVVAVWCAFHGVDRSYFEAYGRDTDDAYHPFRELFECGLLGVIFDDPAGGQRVQRFRQPHEAVAGSRRELPRSRYYLLHPALRAMLERMAGSGRFTAIRHVTIGHGAPWPRHADLVVDVQRELLRRPHAAPEIGEAAQALLERLAVEVAGGAHVEAVRRALARSPAFARLVAALERSGWDELHLALLELFPNDRAAEVEPTSPQTGRREAEGQAPSLAPTLDAAEATDPDPRG